MDLKIVTFNIRCDYGQDGSFSRTEPFWKSQRCGYFLCHLGGGVYAKTEEIQAYQVHGEDLAL